MHCFEYLQPLVPEELAEKSTGLDQRWDRLVEFPPLVPLCSGSCFTEEILMVASCLTRGGLIDSGALGGCSVLMTGGCVSSEVIVSLPKAGCEGSLLGHITGVW